MSCIDVLTCVDSIQDVFKKCHYLDEYFCQQFRVKAVEENSLNSKIAEEAGQWIKA
jgi:hypothetical protein